MGNMIHSSIIPVIILSLQHVSIYSHIQMTKVLSWWVMSWVLAGLLAPWSSFRNNFLVGYKKMFAASKKSVSAAFLAKIVHVTLWINKHSGNERIKNAVINHILPWHHKHSSITVKMWPCIFSFLKRRLKWLELCGSSHVISNSWNVLFF